MRNNCLKCVRQAKADFIREKLEENKCDSKKFWNNINSLLPRKNKSSQELSLADNGLDVASYDLPNFMNNYFSNIGANLAGKFKDQPVIGTDNTPSDECPNVLRPFFTTELELLKFIRELKISKSSAIEHLSTKVLKVAFASQITRLARIFNISLSRGYIPDCWKRASVVPLHKGGDIKDINNYRPVSLLPVQGKLIEKIVHERIKSHIEANELLDPKQGGSRKDHSTTDTSVKFLNDIYTAMNDGNITIAVFIDLRKAFDTVNHNILCNKLMKYGIKDRNLKWIRNYLDNRTQKTIVNCSDSEYLPVTCGVPQGSVLGPLLFLVYVNNMSKCLRSTSHCLYADDTVLFMSGNDIEVMINDLQGDLTRYSEWCSNNYLTLNAKKTKYVIFGTRQRTKNIRNFDLTLNGTKLFKEPFYKYLGITLDDHLSYKQHIDQCTKIVSHKIYLLSKIRRFINEETALFIFRSMIAPILDYGDIIYMGGSENGLSKLQKLQNRALRICVDIHHYIPTILLHQQADVPNLVTRRSCNLKKYMYKQKNDFDLIKIPIRNTRLNDAVIFNTVRPNIEKFKCNPLYKGAVLWNSLSVELRNCEDYTSFKLLLKEWAHDVTMLNV